MAEVEKGTALDDISVASITTKGRPTNVKLNKDIWMRSLPRGPTKERFLPIKHRTSQLLQYTFQLTKQPSQIRSWMKERIGSSGRGDEAS